MTPNEIARLRAHLREIILGWSNVEESDLQPLVEDVMGEIVTSIARALDAAHARIIEFERALADARLALKPFARANVAAVDGSPTNECDLLDEFALWTNTPSVGDLRRARDVYHALADKPKEADGE